MQKTIMLGASAAALALALSGCGVAAQSSQPVNNKPVSATTEAPAQNVRIPETNERMSQESAEGLASFTYYYFDAKNYAIQTGEARLMREIAAGCESCLAEADAIEAVYAGGGWIVGGQPKALNVFATGELDKKGKVSAIVPFMEDGSSIMDKDGSLVEAKEWNPAGTTLTVGANYQDGAWHMVSVEETPDAELPE